MHVTGDRTAEHGLATVGYDDEGVAGAVLGHDPRRRPGRLPAGPADGAAARGSGRSNGCAFADSPGHMPMQRMANVSLQPAAGGPSTAELIAGVEDGIYIVGDKSWSIDMQRYNFQFTGQRFFRIRNGRLDGPAARRRLPGDHHRLLGLDGGRRRAADLRARRRVQLRQGPARPGRAGQPRLPAVLLRGVRILNTAEEGRHHEARAFPAGNRRARAGRGQVRRLRGDRRGDLHREPALGGQHAHHQRRGALPRSSPSSRSTGAAGTARRHRRGVPGRRPARPDRGRGARGRAGGRGGAPRRGRGRAAGGGRTRPVRDR